MGNQNICSPSPFCLLFTLQESRRKINWFLVSYIDRSLTSQHFLSEILNAFNMWQINFCFTITLSYHKNRIPQIINKSKETPHKLNECAKCKLAKFRGDPTSWWNIKLPLATSSASRWVTWSPASAPATTTTRWGRPEPSRAGLPAHFRFHWSFLLLLAQNLLETLENF